MDSIPQPLDCYELIGRASQTMLDAARQGDWDGLVAAEASCAQWMALLREVDRRSAALDPIASQRKFDIISQVLAREGAIRVLTQARLAELEALLGAAHRSHRVDALYRA